MHLFLGPHSTRARYIIDMMKTDELYAKSVNTHNALHKVARHVVRVEV